MIKLAFHVIQSLVSSHQISPKKVSKIRQFSVVENYRILVLYTITNNSNLDCGSCFYTCGSFICSIPVITEYFSCNVETYCFLGQACSVLSTCLAASHCSALSLCAFSKIFLGSRREPCYTCFSGGFDGDKRPRGVS